MLPSCEVGEDTCEPKAHTTPKEPSSIASSVDTAKVALEIEGEATKRGDPARAEHEKRYLKSDLDHFGASVPAIRRIAKGARRPFAASPRRPGAPRRGALGAAGARVPDGDGGAARPWVGASARRRHGVDRAADSGVEDVGAGGRPRSERGRRARRAPPRARGDARSLGIGRGLLGRRSALLALLLPLRRGGDFERLALRGRHARGAAVLYPQGDRLVAETARKQPDRVAEWLAPRARRASGVTVREAVKYLSDAQRGDLVGQSRRPDASSSVTARLRADRVNARR